MLPSRSVEISRMDFPSASAPCSTWRGTHLRRSLWIHLATWRALLRAPRTASCPCAPRSRCGVPNRSCWL